MSRQLQTEYFKTSEEYLASERIAEQKHEYLAGVIYAMAGATADHQRIAGNIYRHLGNQLSGKRCEVFSSDMKVRIRRGGGSFFYYPDVTVDCSNPAGDSHFVDEPRMIVEVLSRETGRIDRGEKLRNYQEISALEVYALVDQFHIAVTVYRRSDGNWSMEFFAEKEDVLQLPEIGCALPMTAIYERTHLVR